MQRRGRDSGIPSAVWDLGSCFLWLGPRLDRGTRHLALAWPDLPALNRPLHPPHMLGRPLLQSSTGFPGTAFEPRQHRSILTTPRGNVL